MTAFVLETLTGREWRRGGRIYWTIEAARREAQRLVSARRAVAVRILAADVDLQSVEIIPASETPANDARPATREVDHGQ